MNKRTSIIAFAILVAAAVFFGFILVNKGDGPVTGMIISDKTLEDIESYKIQEKSHRSGNYMILAAEYNKFNEKFKSSIPMGKDLYFNISIVESPKGSSFTARWLSDGKAIKEETKELSINQRGVVSYILDSKLANKGSFTFELYYDSKKIFEKSFQIE